MKQVSSFSAWNAEKSAELYGIRRWGAGHFDINEDTGDVVITAEDVNGNDTTVSLMDIVKGTLDRGLQLPLVLRVSNLLHAQISKLHESFRRAIKKSDYQGYYKGVYPIKVNQQEAIVKEIADFGKQYHHGLEAGSKAELVAALGTLTDPEACLICNGYKDEEFIDLGLYATKMGFNLIFVIEIPSEIELIYERSQALGIQPNIGVRIKLSTRASGQWAESGGDRSVFGLTTSELVVAVDKLSKIGMLNSLKLLHYHIGSQIPNIRDIRSGVREACRIYRGLAEEGAPMGYLDLGGGLAVDYDGSHTNFACSRNYTLDEYTEDIIDTVVSTLQDTPIEHPTIVTESGRNVVAYSSILLFDILDVARFEPQQLPDKIAPEAHELLHNLMESYQSLSQRNVQEIFNDAVYYKDELSQHFRSGRISLRTRATGENIFWNIMVKINGILPKLKHIPEECANLPSLISDIYYSNFSLFQSLPDVWAIDQLFPIMPIHRLRECPTRQGILSDITCDCDGKIDHFIDLRDVSQTLQLHELKPDEPYILGTFLVGAYQETLGDLHNLLGDTNVVTVKLTPNNTFEFEEELEGDTVSDVLSYVEYDPKELLTKFRQYAEKAVRAGTITANERRAILHAYSDGLRGYTYYER